MEVTEEIKVLSRVVDIFRELQEEETAKERFLQLLQKNEKPYDWTHQWYNGLCEQRDALLIYIYDRDGRKYRCPEDYHHSTGSGEVDEGEGEGIVDFIIDLLQQGIIPERFRVVRIYRDDNDDTDEYEAYEGTLDERHWKIIKKRLCSALCH